MTDELSVDEHALIGRLREIPEGPARTELLGLIQDLVNYVSDPRCGSAQADGVPCATVSGECEECQSVVRALATLHGCVRLT